MRTAESLTDIEREIIADVQAVCQRCGWPADLRPTLQDYLAHGGRFDVNLVNRIGGWKRICALAGMRHTCPPRAPVVCRVRRAARPIPTPAPVYPSALDANADGESPDAELARRLDASMDFIRRRFREGITLGDVGKAAGYSPFHLHRLFHRHFGRTPKQVITELQVAEAQRLMAGGTPLREVGPLAGFAHQSHFTSRFKQVTLTTPARWLGGHRGRPALPPPEPMPEAA